VSDSDLAYASRLRHRNYDVIVLSPHFDDGVYSLAATISRAVNEGKRVVVVTVFGHGHVSPPASSGPYGDYRTRESEDRAAMDALDADYVWLNRPEWTFRSSRGRELVSELIPHASFRGTRLLEDTARSLADVITALRNDESVVYAPLAVGAHPDHRLVHEAARSLTLRNEVRFYEDVPYALDEALVEARLAVLCALPGPRAARVARATARLVARGLTRTLALIPLFFFFAALELHRRLRTPRERRVDPLALRSFDHDIARFARDKARAVALYGSQTALFFDSRTTLESQLARGRNAIVERSWRLAS